MPRRVRSVFLSLSLLTLGAWAVARAAPPAQEPERYDVVVYGGTSGGVMAAVRVAREGRSVVLVEPSAHLGGLSAAGLGATDIGDRRAIGGMSRAFYGALRAHYARDEAWVQEPREGSAAWRAASPDAMWRFEPHVAEAEFERLVAEAGVPVLRGERLVWGAGVERDGARIVALRLESGRRLAARLFVDATYEGDLLAQAGVSYHVGRESNATYGETLNGVQTANARYHQLMEAVDAFVVPGDPESGLLPGVSADGPGEEGEGDARVQAYCFRMCLTDDPANRVPFTEPEGYDPLRYELLLRNFEAGETRAPWHCVPMPNRKTDTNNNRGVSTDGIGMNWRYPEADYAERARIVAEHERYQRGLLWTLATDPRVPEAVRAEVSRYGLAKDEFVDNGHWPHQIYVREGRRMVGEYVMTELDCTGRRRAPDPVGLGAYNMDSHNVQRYVDARGHARNEGDVQVKPAGPYRISWRALLPKREECTNLLVPVALSSSHIAYGSIRMEPVFMILGHSAGTAACLALEQDVALHDLDYAALRARLVAEGQVLEVEG